MSDPFDDYAEKAWQTVSFKDQGIAVRQLIPLLGLASEAGSLINIAKKSLRQPEAELELSREFIKEELADLMWYIAVAAKSHDLKLGEVAEFGLKRSSDYFAGTETSVELDVDDSGYEHVEHFPRLSVFEFTDHDEDGELTARIVLKHADPNPFSDGLITVNGKDHGFKIGDDIGAMLTDNSRRVDGYRFHDALHMGLMSVLGWSPVMRSVLRLKRRSNPTVDNAQDGARAIFTEEAIAAALARLAEGRNQFSHETFVDSETIALIKTLVRDLEVEDIPGHRWKIAIVEAFQALNQLKNQRGGYLACNRDTRTLRYYGSMTRVEEIVAAEAARGS